MKDLRSKLIIGGLVGLAVIIGLLIYANLREVGAYAARFPLVFIGPILLLTLFNYVGRWLKWQYYLSLIGVTNISPFDSAVLWVSGFCLAITPGKVGEFLKAAVLRNMTGTPVERSAPVVLAERLTDGLAMFVLAAIGFGGILLTAGQNEAVYRYVPAYFITLAIIAAGVVAIQIRPLAEWGLGVAEKLPLIGKYSAIFRELYESTNILLKPVPILFAVALGVVCWSGEAVGFFLILWGMGLEPTWLLLWQAVFILAIATIVGAISGLPGGLGAAEVTVIGMIQLLVINDAGFAGTASIFVRISTLWFAVVLGLFTAFVFRHKLFPARADQLWRLELDDESATLR
ncbi:MAG: lysylphosphatidylglycerol synthase transmembrane domain-containing protein [Anaerolineae bacterium]